jgi:WD40 repeat protein
VGPGERQARLVLEGHTGMVRAVAVTADGRRAVSASFDHSLRLWDLESRKEIATFIGESDMTSCAVSPDEQTIVAGYPVPPIIRSPPVVLDCDDVYSVFFERKKKLVRKFLYSAGPNIWRNLSKPSRRFLDLLDASGERFRKAFRGFAVKRIASRYSCLASLSNSALIAERALEPNAGLQQSLDQRG